MARMRQIVVLVVAAVSFSGIATDALADSLQQRSDAMMQILRNRQRCAQNAANCVNKTPERGLEAALAAVPKTVPEYVPATKTQGVVMVASAPTPHEGLKVPSTIFVPAPQTAQAYTNAGEPSGWWDKNTYLDGNVYAGVWGNPKANTMGVWTQAEVYNMFRMGRQNMGVGVIGKFDRGWNDKGNYWGYAAVGPRVNFQTPTGDNGFFQVKAGPEYRFNNGNKANGWGASGRAEYGQVLTSRDKLTVAVDGTYYPDDSYLGASLIWDHWWTGWLRSKIGITTGINFMSDMNSVGVGPWAGVTMWDTLDLGCGVQWGPFGPTWGCLAGVNVNNGLRKYDAHIRKKGVVSKSPNTSEAVPGAVELVDNGNGVYTTALPGTENSISTKTLDEVQ